MNIITLLWLLVIAGSAQAEVYKCQASAKQIPHQSIPCSADTANQNIVKIKKLDARQLGAERQALYKLEQTLNEEDQDQRELNIFQQQAIVAKQQTAIINPYYRSNRRGYNYYGISNYRGGYNYYSNSNYRGGYNYYGGSNYRGGYNPYYGGSNYRGGYNPYYGSSNYRGGYNSYGDSFFGNWRSGRGRH